MNELLNIARGLAKERKKKIAIGKEKNAEFTIDLSQISIGKDYRYQYIRAYIQDVPLFRNRSVDVFYAYLQKTEINYFSSSSNASSSQNEKEINTVVSCNESRVIQYEIDSCKAIDANLKAVIDAIPVGDYVIELSKEEYMKLSNENETDFYTFCTYTQA